jgi:hypothetical protein
MPADDVAAAGPCVIPPFLIHRVFQHYPTATARACGRQDTEHLMPTQHPDVAGRPGADPLEPLAVSPRQACLLLGVGTTRLYQLIRDGEVITYHEGRARRVLMASIRARVARLAGAAANSDTAQPRRRGRPRTPPSEAERCDRSRSIRD